jgi:uncharacterized protein (TIGR02594 family)
MLGIVAFCRPLAALALCIAAIAVSVTPASARSFHRSAHHAQAYAGHQARWHHAQYHSRYQHRYVVRQSRWQREAAPMQAPGNAFVTPNPETRIVRYQPRRSYRHVAQEPRDRGVAEMQTRGLANSHASVVPNTGGVTFESAAAFGSGLVADARRYLGGNPTGRGSLWCARFMNMVLQHNGYRGTGSDMASSFAHYGTRISGPQVGAIAVMSRGRSGGHVGIISGIDASGNPIMISGNNGNRVREAPISRGRIYAYVMPN